MQKLFLTFLIALLWVFAGYAQPVDVVLNSPESGNVVHNATNSVTFSPGYSYTPSSSEMTAKIVEQIITGYTSYNYYAVNPESRALNTSYSPGTTQGTFNVSPAGSATYTIPIDVPPGVSGLQPNLAITYNSMSGDGVAGYGWNISGASVITRIPKSFYYDIASGTVELNSNDRFSLDGQRLLCTSGSYGGNSSQYRTENDIFTRVTCTTGSYGPAKFLAETKGGLEYQYGYTSDANQIVDGHNETVSWYVNKVTDVYGNQINYEYLNNNGKVYLTEIDYGPNTIAFFYKQRSDTTTTYLVGSKIKQALLLSNVKIKYNSSVVKEYEFKYTYSSSSYTQHSFLNEVIEYGIGGSRFNSTAFSYQTPDNVTFKQTVYNTTNSYVTYKSKLVAGDFNGDGKTDFLCLPKSGLASWTGMKVCYGDGKDNFSLGFSDATSLDLNSLDDIRALDINGDGKDDLLYEVISSGNSNFYYRVNTGGGFASPVLIRSVSARSTDTGLSGKKRRRVDKQQNDNEMSGDDYNGDGINDVFINDANGDWWIYSFGSSTGTLFGSMSLKGSGTISTMADQVLSADFNGDGKADIWSFDDSGMKIYTFTGSTLTQLYGSTWPTKNHKFTLGDFNGDGKVDMFVYAYQNGSTWYDWSNWQVQLSTGTGFDGKFIPQKKSKLYNDYIRLGDFNGDGTTDIMVTSTDQSWSGTYFYSSENGGSNFYSNYLSNYPPASHNFYVADYNGDGRTDFMCTDGESPWWNGYQIYKSGTKNRPLLEKVTNGLNQHTKITYKELSAPNSPYTKGTGAQFPVLDYDGALPVVDSVLTDNGVGSQNLTTYAYEGAKIHQQGKGFLCYSKITIKDVASNSSTESNYDYNTTLYFPELTSTVTKVGATTTATVSNNWAFFTTASGTYARSAIYPYISSSTQTDNLTGNSVAMVSSYDTYGNLTSLQKTYNNGVTETTVNTYSNDASNWLLGRLTSSAVSYAKSGETTINKTVSYTYSSDGILKPDLIKSFEGTSVAYTKNFDYNGNGNVTKLTESSSVGNRVTSYTYTSDGTRLQSTTDPLSHTTTRNYDSYGRLNSEVDYLNNTTSYTYDNFGRVTSKSGPDGSVSTTTYNWGLSGGPANACYFVEQAGNDGSSSKTWYDKLGRGIRKDTKGFDGSYIYTAKEYNSKGQVYRTSEPDFSATPSQWNTNTYDAYGRISHISRPSGRSSDYSYSGKRVTETTGGKTKWKETDSQGLVTQVHDNGGDIVYSYFPDGKVKTVTAPGGVVTTMGYDAAGNRSDLTDPSAGNIHSEYNGFGQLRFQTNGRNQATTYNFYADGRPDTKVTPEGTTTYSYNSNKQLANITSPDNVSRAYSYDSKGRISSVSEDIPGSSTLTTSYTYDGYGRLLSKTYPSGIVETRNYNSNGYLESISAGGATRWTVTGMNARQQITSTTYGSSLYATFGFDAYGFPESSKAQAGSVYKQDYRYSFDPVTGNLSSRQNYLKSKSESFSYDNLDRLIGVSGPQNLTMDYEANGNIKTKSDVGLNAFAYTQSSKPYALTEVTSSTGVIPSTTQSATYTSFDQVSTIDEGDYHAAFTYNSDEQRCKMQITDLGSATLTRWYAGNSYMKETAGDTTKEYTWIGGDAYTAPVVAVKVGTQTTWYYLLRDYLGNVTHVVNTSNNVTAEYSYDAWGRRRNAADWSYNVTNEPELLAGRGFTSHEYLPWFKLVNMNGRLYDPVVGRFLSPDPNVQNPYMTQGMNRYSYALNNPLRYIDPTGYTWLSHFGRWIKRAAKWTAKNWVYIADVAITTGAIAAEIATGQAWLIVPTLNAGLNVWNHAYDIKKHPLKFSLYSSIGFGTGYLAVTGGGPLVAGLQTGLNDAVEGGKSVSKIFGDMVMSTVFAGATLALSSAFQTGFKALGANPDFYKPVSNVLASMTGTYMAGAYDGGRWDKWALNGKSLMNITAMGGMSLLSSLNSPPQNLTIPESGWTTFNIPSGPVAPNVNIPMPNIEMPTVIPGFETTPVLPPSPQGVTIPLNINH